MKHRFRLSWIRFLCCQLVTAAIANVNLHILYLQIENLAKISSKRGCVLIIRTRLLGSKKLTQPGCRLQNNTQARLMARLYIIVFPTSIDRAQHACVGALLDSLAPASNE